MALRDHWSSSISPGSISTFKLILGSVSGFSLHRAIARRNWRESLCRSQAVYRDGVVFINSDLAPTSAADVLLLSERLLKVGLEEIAHGVTGATDRDFQNYLLDLAIKLIREKEIK
jgi:hypothetical protein